jgi:hypothetical protein
MAGILGGGAGKSEMKEANALMRDNIAKLEAVGVPTIEAQKIALQSPELVDMLVAEQMGPSAYEQVTVDPRLKQAQLGALEEITQLGQTGLGAADRAAFNDLRRQAAGAAEAQQASTLQEMASRGMADSGANLIAQLSAGQSQADRMSQEGDRLAAQAANARRDALGQQANMSSQIRSQDTAQQQALAESRNAINQFNTQNRQNVAGTNLANRQNIANQATATRNQQEMYNKGLQQQDFQNRMAKATGVVSQQGNLAGQIAQQGQAAAQGQAAQNAALISGAGSLAGAGIGAYGDVAAAKAKAAPAGKYDPNTGKLV